MITDRQFWRLVFLRLLTEGFYPSVAAGYAFQAVQLSRQVENL